MFSRHVSHCSDSAEALRIRCFRERSRAVAATATAAASRGSLPPVRSRSATVDSPPVVGHSESSLSRAAIHKRSVRLSRRTPIAADTNIPSAAQPSSSSSSSSSPSQPDSHHDAAVLRTLQGSMGEVAIVRRERTQAQARSQQDVSEPGALSGWWHNLARSTGTVQPLVERAIVFALWGFTLEGGGSYLVLPLRY